jgi:DNA polymerase I
MPPILLVDTLSLFYRSFFALPPMSTTRGEPTSALYGFASVLLKLLRQEQPAGAAMALDRATVPGRDQDAPYPTFRHAAFRGYKASRRPAPTPLGAQLRRLDDLLEAFGFPTFAVPGFEADDVLATLARELREGGQAPLVVSGDLDLLQCAGGRARVHIVGRGMTEGRTYDEAAVWARFGVAPGELPDWKALAGDPSDELPGVPGVGGKTAAMLVRRFDGVAGLLARLPEVRPARVARALAEVEADLPLWRDLARLRDDVPLPPGPRFAPLAPDARSRVRALFQELEFRSLMPRLETI